MMPTSIKEIFTVPGYEPTSSEFLRKEYGVYYHLRELYNKGKLTTWEMNAIDNMVDGFMSDKTRQLNERGLIEAPFAGLSRYEALKLVKEAVPV